MRNILLKEMRLSASLLSFLFIPFGLMFFLPGYPILCGVFFVTLGIFQSFQNAREANDMVFSALLPISKRDVVKGKYLFTCAIELCGILLMTIAVVFRMTLLSCAAVYRSNALMNANLFALGMAFIGFGLFNLIFVGGFFKTAYRFGRPFVGYTITVFLTICIAEALHHFPGLGFLNAFGTEHFAVQLLLLGIGAAFYLAVTVLSCKKACNHFEKIDL
ncbi:MAG: ABC-2 transporter permease [Candidatus Faecousia sp.]|nr:ABC-2 transporter permease [Candidatus Faecousia sp.]